MNKKEFYKPKELKSVLKSLTKETQESKDLKQIVDKFNVFAVLDVMYKEKIHSNFLAWLLNPNETHILGTLFLEKFFNFLGKTFNYLNKNDLEKTEIYLEANYIDIFIKNDTLKFICVIENKILSYEREKQLNTYKNLVDKKYEDFEKYFVFLTPEKKPANGGQGAYQAMGYKDILDIIDKPILTSIYDCSIRNFILSYRDILENYIIKDSKVEKLNNSIKPQIKSYRRSIQSKITTHINNFLSSHQDFTILASSTNTMIKFSYNKLKINSDILYFELNNQLSLELLLILIPGTDNVDLREKIFNICKENKYIFKDFEVNKESKLLIKKADRGNSVFFKFTEKLIENLIKEEDFNEEIRKLLDKDLTKNDFEIDSIISTLSPEQKILLKEKSKESRTTHIYLYKKTLISKEDYNQIDIENLSNIIDLQIEEFTNTDLKKIISIFDTIKQQTGEYNNV